MVYAEFNLKLAKNQGTKMNIDGKFIEGRFIERVNKYSGIIEIGTINESCFIPNPGRLEELLTLGKKVIIKEINKCLHIHAK